MSAAIIYIIALGTVITVGSGMLPNFSDSVDTASLNLEAYHVSTNILTNPGYSQANGGTTDWHSSANNLDKTSSFGLSNASDSFLVLEREKIQRLKSFPRNDDYLNYTEFKNLTGAKNQYQFNFTWKPVVETHKSYVRGSRSNLTGYWPLDYTSGDIIDESYNSNHATPERLQRGADGVFNSNAIGFDGENNYAYVSSPGDPLSTVSISVWVKTTNTSGDPNMWYRNAPYLVQKDIYGAQSNDWTLALNSGRVVWNTGNPSTNIDDPLFSNRQIADGQWHHIVAVRNEETGVKKIYIDGELDTQHQAYKGNLSNDEFIYFGNSEVLENSFNGILDEIRIYNSVVSQNKVKKLYNNNLGPRIVPPETNYYRKAENVVHYGSTNLNGSGYNFLVTAHDGVYNTTYISRNWDFRGKEPHSVGDSFDLNGEKYRIEGIQNRQNDAGALVTLSQHLKTFGPKANSDSTVINLQRYAIMENEPLEVEVLAW